MKELHALVDFENVQPSLEALAKLAPGFTDVWLFHGPHQAKQAQAFAASHARKGWEVLTDAVIRQVAEGPHPVVFMLWGAHAQSKHALIPADRGHLVLTSNHPSPLSALRPPVPFIGNAHFSQARAFAQRTRSSSENVNLFY